MLFGRTVYAWYKIRIKKLHQIIHKLNDISYSGRRLFLVCSFGLIGFVSAWMNCQNNLIEPASYIQSVNYFSSMRIILGDKKIDDVLIPSVLERTCSLSLILFCSLMYPSLGLFTSFSKFCLIHWNSNFYTTRKKFCVMSPANQWQLHVFTGRRKLQL